MSAAQTELILTKFESAFSLKHDNPMVYKEWRQLVTQQAVLGKPSHDARIAAALIAHDITHLVTFNKGHRTVHRCQMSLAFRGVAAQRGTMRKSAKCAPFSNSEYNMLTILPILAKSLPYL
jgi:hypothetical protein